MPRDDSAALGGGGHGDALGEVNGYRLAWSGRASPWTEGAASAPVPAADAGTARPIEIAWVQPLGLVSLAVTNFIRRILTLGAYDFWGRTEVRRRLWSAVRIEGEPLTYHGTGRELCTGFLIVFAIVMVPLLIGSFLIAGFYGGNPIAIGVFQAIAFLVIAYLTGVGVHRAQRYRLSRTAWRGIRGGLDGNAFAYGWVHLWTLLCIPATLGWIAPWRTTRLQSLIANGMHLGSLPVRFEARSASLYGPFAVLWFTMTIGAFLGTALFGAVAAGIVEGYDPVRDAKTDAYLRTVVGGLAIAFMVAGYLLYLVLSAWYQARVINHFASATRFGQARLSCRASAIGLAWIGVSNALILAAGAVAAVAVMAAIAIPIALVLNQTLPAWSSVALQLAPFAAIIAIAALGILTPVTQARYNRYIVERMAIVGPVDLAAVAQSHGAGADRGEGLSQAFDIDGY
ncbi:MAG: DUF898 family protein [Hyphomicrobiaceae bacterium]|nr:DUF898 family protein [Hyphomicrobiaceae bacterium]